MSRTRWIRFAAFPVILVIGVSGAHTAHATFHFMQIEQVAAGFCGDPTIQAVQLRMRFGGQNLVSASRLRFFDQQGLDPQLLVDLLSDVVNGSAGSRVLVATDAFAARFGITPDATIVTPLPVSLLDAGRLTFESDAGIIYWSLSWGGVAYTGSNAGSLTNDADGDFGPPYSGPLPLSSGQALLFSAGAGSGSSSNSDDYILSAGGVTFTNNAGATVVIGGCVFGDGFERGDVSSWTSQFP